MNFLVKEIKQTYQIDLDDMIIKEAVKKANGDIGKSCRISLPIITIIKYY